MNQKLIILKQFENFLIFNKALSNNSIKSYMSDILQLEKYGLFNIENINKHDSKINTQKISNFIINNENHSKSTKARYIASLKIFFEFIYNEYGHDLIIDINIKNNKYVKYISSQLIMKNINDSIDPSADQIKLKDIRNLCIAGILCGTGARVSELINIKFQDITKDSILLHGKGSKKRLVPINLTSKKYIEKYNNIINALILRTGKNIKDIKYFFFNDNGQKFTRQRIFQIIKSLSLDKSPHDLRHAFATSLVNQGVDLKILQSILGHSSISSTEIYTHIGNKKILKDMNNMHPINNMLI